MPACLPNQGGDRRRWRLLACRVLLFIVQPCGKDPSGVSEQRRESQVGERLVSDEFVARCDRSPVGLDQQFVQVRDGRIERGEIGHRFASNHANTSPSSVKKLKNAHGGSP